ncbi:MAG: aspartate/tyrosine/aromatic aminotransferase [Gammaproteobacteria bacterium]|nr:aspartate/tyrosine/aromatic aminotransferase [Gammaproteobacteria bacterium]
MFQSLSRLSEDAILGVMAKFRADPSPLKVDLGVGVYRDAAGNTPVLDCVRRAERDVLAAQTTKSYVAPAGRAEFNEAVIELVLGAGHPAVADRRVVALQAPGGCGALRVGAELVRTAAASATVHVSDPTWANHVPLIGGSGLRLARYPYYDAVARRLTFDAMLERLECAPEGDVVLIHACCHNPTGADLEPPQWKALTELLLRRRLIPYLDLAYQGFGEDEVTDAAGVRLVAQSVPECLIATSFSKNLGLYRERVGALLVVGESESRAAAIRSHVLQIARSIYSMPPDHGAAIAARIFCDQELRRAWIGELAAMRGRINAMRTLLADTLRGLRGDRTFDFLERQRGMFSLLGASAEAVGRLQAEHHVYMTGDGRMNLAGVMPGNVEYLAGAICRVMS